MADNYRKCDLCGEFFTVTEDYKPLNMPNLWYRNGIASEIVGLVGLSGTPRRTFPTVETEVCDLCLAVIIDTLRDLNRHGTTKYWTELICPHCGKSNGKFLYTTVQDMIDWSCERCGQNFNLDGGKANGN